MKHHTFVLISLCFLLLVSCEKPEETPTADCSQLKWGLMMRDSEVLTVQINYLLNDLEPESSTTDGLGHGDNLEILIDRMTTQCDSIEAEILCYACIKTLPAQSEIAVHIDSAGTYLSRTIDILTPGDGAMTYFANH